jgi:polysaccharide deacetylase 2 family uncharacterized protein YibQ
VGIALSIGATLGWLTDIEPPRREPERPEKSAAIAPPATVPLPARPTPPQPPLAAPTPSRAPATPSAPAALAPPPILERAALPAWQRHAVRAAWADDKIPIAIMIDDAGLNRRNAHRLNRLRAPLSIAFMAYADDLGRQAQAARAAGHEIWLHAPMEPADAGEKPGPQALLTHLSEAELRSRLEWMLARIEGGFVGLNNHMGSKFTAQAAGMDLVMATIKPYGVAFLDSRTSAQSVAAEAARRHGVPFVARDVFLDNDHSADNVRRQLSVAEDVARKQGYAIAIGHPHNGTIEALEAWLATLDRRGFVLVPVSAVVRKRSGG